MIKFLVTALAFLSLAWCDEQMTVNVPVDKDTCNQFARSKAIVSPLTWQSAYEVIEGKTILKNHSQNLPLIGFSEMFALCESQDNESQIPSVIPAMYADYIRTGMNPGMATQCNLDENANKTLPVTELGGSDHLLQNCLDVYFPATETETFYNLPGCAKNVWSAKNVRCLESLCAMGKEVLVFVWVAGDWRNANAGAIDVQLQQQAGGVQALPAVGAHALVLVGFNQETRQFIFRNCWGRETGQNGYLYLSYDYIRTYACEAFYGEKEESISGNAFQIASASISIRKWDVGGGNFFRPKAKVWGSVSGSSSDIVSVRLLVQYSNGRRIVLEEETTKPGASFYMSGRYSRANATYAIVEILNSSKKITAFVRYKI